MKLLSRSSLLSPLSSSLSQLLWAPKSILLLKTSGCSSSVMRAMPLVRLFSSWFFRDPLHRHFHFWKPIIPLEDLLGQNLKKGSRLIFSPSRLQNGPWEACNTFISPFKGKCNYFPDASDQSLVGNVACPPTYLIYQTHLKLYKETWQGFSLLAKGEMVAPHEAKMAATLYSLDFLYTQFGTVVIDAGTKV